jgi:hypothetical protein
MRIVVAFVCSFGAIGYLALGQPETSVAADMLDRGRSIQGTGTGDAYRCRVAGVSELSDDGALSPSTAQMRKAVVGSTFVVERRSGRIVGGVGNNATFESRTVVFTPPANPFRFATGLRVHGNRSCWRNLEQSIRGSASGRGPNRFAGD